ncbi:MAG: YARHG domain-containing protein [Pseudanabaenales cyanobacterium]|nr:YARHG domain-containing protein [Pseudanabaenales cyanobacterium]
MSFSEESYTEEQIASLKEKIDDRVRSSRKQASMVSAVTLVACFIGGLVLIFTVMQARRYRTQVKYLQEQQELLERRNTTLEEEISNAEQKLQRLREKAVKAEEDMSQLNDELSKLNALQGDLRKVKERRNQLENKVGEIRSEIEQLNSQISSSIANLPSDYDWLSIRAITREDLVGKSAFDLTIMRNSIYARHGRKFNRQAIQSYFNSQTWYKAIYSPEEFPNSLLSQIERNNAAKILEYQRQNGLLF